MSGLAARRPLIRSVSAAALPRVALAGFGLLIACLERARQRRALAQLDDQQLRDIGLDRPTAEREAARPGWRI